MPLAPLFSPSTVLQTYETSLRTAYASGALTPVVLPYHGLGLSVVIAYLLLPPTKSYFVRNLRFPVFIFYAFWSFHVARETRSPSPHLSYGIGIVGAWAVVWLAALILWKDGRSECRRIWPVDEPTAADGAKVPNGYVNGGPHSPSTTAGTANTSAKRTSTKDQQQLDPNDIHSTPQPKIKQYFWQPLPEPFLERFHWVLDFGISMRAVGWSHAVRGLPLPPKEVMARLSGPMPKSYIAPSRPICRSFATRRGLFLHSVASFVTCYIVLDVLKTLAMRDPYFLAFISEPSPFTNSWLFARTYRSVATMTFVGVGLQMVFTLNPLFFAFVCGDERYLQLGIRAESWVYPTVYGPFSAVWKSGLRGLWGVWWHHIFRLGFSAPVDAWVDYAGWDAKGRDKVKTNALGLVVAFGFSGLLHAAASWTSLGKTNPIMSILFFALQGIGVVLEGIVLAKIRGLESVKKMPSWLKKVAAFTFVFCWMCLTAPLLCDDFARGGIWLFEPVPLSPIRGWKGEGWWRWASGSVWWHVDARGRWWRSGLAF